MIRKFDEWFIVHVWIRGWVAIHNTIACLGLPESWQDYCIGRIEYALEVYAPNGGDNAKG